MIPTESIEDLISRLRQWIYKAVEHLERHYVPRTETMITMPCYMKNLIIDDLRERYPEYVRRLKPTTVIVWEGFGVSFDAPTHHVYVYHESWPMFPALQLRQIFQLPIADTELILMTYKQWDWEFLSTKTNIYQYPAIINE